MAVNPNIFILGSDRYGPIPIYSTLKLHASLRRFRRFHIYPFDCSLDELFPGYTFLRFTMQNSTIDGVHLILRSQNLIGIASKQRHHEALVADALDLPHPCSKFDFAISIAVIHHFSSQERRVAAIKSILLTLKPITGNESETGGKALIYVWALEQESSRRGWGENSAQDVFVPWVMQKKFAGMLPYIPSTAATNIRHAWLTLWIKACVTKVVSLMDQKKMTRRSKHINDIITYIDKAN